MVEIKKNYSYQILRLSVLFLYLNSMLPWYLWNNIFTQITISLSFLIFFALLLSRQSLFQFNKANKLFSLTIILYFCYLLATTFSLFNIFILIIFIGLIFLKDKYKCNVIEFITKYFSIILIISLMFYILWLIGFTLFSPSVIEYVDGRYRSLNYVFFIIPINAEQISSYFRFKSIFMEPGHMTMGIIPLLIINKFNFKNRYVLFLFIVELFSFSLAGYITMAFGYILINLNKYNLYRIIRIFTVLMLSVIILNNFGYGKMLDEFLWSRMEITKNYKLTGDNRSNAALDKYYENVMNSSDKWFGRENNHIAGAGYKMYLSTKGIISAILMSFFYLFGILYYKNYQIFVFTTVIFLLFFQNAYPLWFCNIISYICGLAYIRNSGISSKSILNNQFNNN